MGKSHPRYLSQQSPKHQRKGYCSSSPDSLVADIVGLDFGLELTSRKQPRRVESTHILD